MSEIPSRIPHGVDVVAMEGAIARLEVAALKKLTREVRVFRDFDRVAQRSPESSFSTVFLKVGLVPDYVPAGTPPDTAVVQIDLFDAKPEDQDVDVDEYARRIASGLRDVARTWNELADAIDPDAR